MKTLRVGMVNFINTSPLYVPWREMGPLEPWEVVEGTPSRLNALLSRGEIDVGLVSSFAYGKNWRSYRLLPGLSISATGCVGSVLLFSTVPVETLHGAKVALTPQSATSVNLLYIILEDFYGLRPSYAPGTFHDLERGAARAYLAIGDEALRLRDKGGELYVLDLAKVWLEETGLPFVFAVWAARKDSFQANYKEFFMLCNRLVSCYDKGRKDLERISREVSGRIPMSREDCLRYLEGIELDFSRDKERGLRLFFERLYEKKRLPELPELDFITQPGGRGLPEACRWAP